MWPDSMSSGSQLRILYYCAVLKRDGSRKVSYHSRPGAFRLLWINLMNQLASAKRSERADPLSKVWHTRRIGTKLVVIGLLVVAPIGCRPHSGVPVDVKTAILGTWRTGSGISA